MAASARPSVVEKRLAKVRMPSMTLFGRSASAKMPLRVRIAMRSSPEEDEEEEGAGRGV